MLDYRSELTEMIKRYLKGEATSAEAEFLDAYYSFFEREENLTDNLSPEEKDKLQRVLESQVWEVINEEEK